MHLDEYLYHKKIKVKDFAALINYHRLYIGIVAMGKKLPSKKTMDIIIKATDNMVTYEDMMKFYVETQSLKEINE